MENSIRNARLDIWKVFEEKTARMEAGANRRNALAEEAARKAAEKTAMKRERLQERKNRQPRRRRF
ncbi:MAG: hypothetical protein NTW59_03825 [Candidatus Diapherotrites archaeon]|nr:hypothetical protein [Candidatus Diapherotrites archaeon]